MNLIFKENLGFVVKRNSPWTVCCRCLCWIFISWRTVVSDMELEILFKTLTADCNHVL